MAPFTMADIAETLGDMIDLADAWATCGPETYTEDERKRRNYAERIRIKLDRMASDPMAFRRWVEGGN